jgi:two-component sensor histidine kinase
MSVPGQTRHFDLRVTSGLRSPPAIPLGFIASELITNAAKYGIGQIAHQAAAESRIWLCAFDFQ